MKSPYASIQDINHYGNVYHIRPVYTSFYPAISPEYIHPFRLLALRELVQHQCLEELEVEVHPHHANHRVVRIVTGSPAR